MSLGNIRGEIPIHGFLTTNPCWRLMDVAADESSAWATSRLEFFRHPTWMSQFPFAHTIDITYRLQNGVLGWRPAFTICRSIRCRSQLDSIRIFS